MNQETNQETKRIEAYAIDDFVKQIQEAALDGFRLNLEDNEKYPLQIGVGFYCTMDKVNNKDLTVNLVVDTKQAVEVIKNTLEGVQTLSLAEREKIIQDAIKEVDSVVQSKPGRKPKV